MAAMAPEWSQSMLPARQRWWAEVARPSPGAKLSA